MQYQTLIVEIRDKVAKIILNRPEKKNAMSPQLHKDMTAALEELRYDDAAAVVVITGSGESFCAGMDLKEFFHELKSKPAEYDRILRLAVEWRGRTLRQFPKPTIAMVNGYCFGGAFSIVEGCDLAVTADEAQFVSMIQLDALFFLRDARAAASGQLDSAPQEAAATHGRKVAMALPNGKELIGSTLNYSRDGSGFFVHPLDSYSGALRVFVTQSGIRNVRFL